MKPTNMETASRVKRIFFPAVVSILTVSPMANSDTASLGDGRSITSKLEQPDISARDTPMMGKKPRMLIAAATVLRLSDA